jgi:hypothetical protein
MHCHRLHPANPTWQVDGAHPTIRAADRPYPRTSLARTVGWVAHWNEMIADQGTRLFRPRQLYTGSTERPLVPIAERATHKPLVG